MTETSGPGRRDRDLEAIRTAYQGYVARDRYRLWDPSNPGYARILRDRDAALSELLRQSLAADGTGRVLDLGCGNGRLAGVARDAGVGVASWSGVDLDPRQIATAREVQPWASFLEASVDEMPFAAGSFDVAIAATLFSSLPSPELERAAAAEVARVIRPGGWLIWYDLRYDNPRNAAVHGVTRASLRQLFGGWRTEVRTVTLAPPLARRLGFAVPFAYPILEGIPLLRSHLIGRLQRPA